MKKQTVRDLTHIAIVAALYVVLTIVPPFNLISYGPYQFRIAEMFNLLGFYNRKYIIAVTLGCVIANFFSFNMIDVVVGSLSTLVFVGSGVYFFDRFKNQDILGGLLDKAHVYFAFYYSSAILGYLVHCRFRRIGVTLSWCGPYQEIGQSNRFCFVK